MCVHCWPWIYVGATTSNPASASLFPHWLTPAYIRSMLGTGHVLLHRPYQLPGRCTLMAQVPSLCVHSITCILCLWWIFMISMLSLSAPCLPKTLIPTMMGRWMLPSKRSSRPSTAVGMHLRLTSWTTNNQMPLKPRSEPTTWTSTCPPPQSPSQRCWMHDSNFQGTFHFCPHYSWHALSAPTLGQLSAPGGTDTKPPVILWWDQTRAANEDVNWKFDCNKTPLAPLGAKGLMYEDLAVWAS